MKLPCIPILALVLCFITATSNAQETSSKPRLFSNYPDKILVPQNSLKDAMNFRAGENVTLQLGSNLVFSGMVISNEFKYSNLRSTIIRSPFFDNAVLAISQITNPDKTITYTGRILNMKASDGYEIKQDLSGTYSLQKFETNRILQDCSY